ncbi:MAG: hypothetical protein H7Y42_12805 [Chitinophagaceae bacterium]|nr:hypothetical protein [Chitinophagaceae bacterium]
MKYQHLLGICLSLILFCATTSAQDHVRVNEPDKNKPLLFSNLPDQIPVHVLDLQSLVNTDNGREVTLSLGKSTSGAFAGKVVSKANKYNNNIKSVVIRSSNFNGATLTLSSSIQPNGTVKFTGRILSLQHGDLYELKNQDNQYILIKKNFYDLINE